jgi:hypothetical protein
LLERRESLIRNKKEIEQVKRNVGAIMKSKINAWIEKVVVKRG